MADKKPAIIVISSHVVRGTVGNRAAAFALEVLGYPVWIVPTITLPWHPGHNQAAGHGSRIVPEPEAFNTLINDLINAPWLGEVGAVLSGYLGNSQQVAPVARLVDAVKTVNSEALYTLDPVIGDGEQLYVPESQAAAIRNHLLPKADLVTPNPFELAWLAGSPPLTNNEELLHAAGLLGVPITVATSAFAMMQGHTGNLLVNGDKTLLAEHPYMPGPPNGLGDLTAALMLGNLLKTGNAAKALEKTSASVFETMAAAARTGADELTLESNLESLRNPRAQVGMRTLLNKNI